MIFDGLTFTINCDIVLAETTISTQRWALSSVSGAIGVAYTSIENWCDLVNNHLQGGQSLNMTSHLVE